MKDFNQTAMALLGRPTQQPSPEIYLDAQMSEDWNEIQNTLQLQIRERDEGLYEFNKNKTPDSGDIWSAAFNRENTLGSWMALEMIPQSPVVEGYDPYTKNEDGSTDIDGYEQFGELFATSRNPETTAIIKKRIDRENRDRQILDNGGFQGLLASVAAGITDPINLASLAVPLSGQIKTAEIVAGAVTTSIASEIGLQQSQFTRSGSESAANIVASAVVSGVLGKSLASLDVAQRETFTRQVIDAISEPRSVGAAQVGVTGEKVVTNGPLSKIALAMSKITPLGRTLTSQVKSVRSAAQKLAESRVALEGDYIPTSVESLVKKDYADFDLTILEVRSLQKQFKKDTGGSDLDFNTMLITAMRNGDQSPDALVTKAAQMLRKPMDALWDRAFEAKLPGTGFLSPDGQGGDVWTRVEATTAKSYMTRRYDLNVVRNDPEGFKRAWMAGITDQRIRNNEPALTSDELYEVATDIYEKVSKLGDGDLHFSTGPSGAAMFGQRVDVKDDFLRDYLVQDWEQLFMGYAKGVSPRVRLTESFSDDFSLKNTISGIRDDYARAINQLDKKIDQTSGTGPRNKLVKERDALSKKMESDIRDIEIMRDRILNATQEPGWLNPENRGLLSALRTARSWNVVTSLSNILVSSIPDMARVITYNGGMKAIKAFIKSGFNGEIKRSKLPTNDIAKIASAMERTSAYRLSHVTEIEDGVVYTAADKYAHKAADLVLTASGSKHWNSVMKTVAGYLISDRMGMALKAGDTKILKSLGLTDDGIKRATAEFNKYGSDDDGMWSLNVDLWKDREIVENIQAAAIREADGLIVTPGVGDKPILMTSEFGKTIFQFMSYIVSATNRIMLPIGQEKGLRPWMEIITSLGLGAAVYALKQKLSGKEPSDDPAVVMAAAIENTGLAGYAGQMAVMGSSLSGLSPLEQTNKFHNAAGVSRYLGPTAGLAENILKAANADTRPAQRAKAMRKLMPMQNHFLLRKAYDDLEQKSAELMGQSSGPSL